MMINPWEMVDNPFAGRSEPTWWVQRKGYNARTEANDAPYEVRFALSGDADPTELVNHLNQLDATRTRIVSLEYVIRGLLAEPYGCPFCDAGTLRNASKNHTGTCPYAVAHRIMSTQI